MIESELSELDYLREIERLAKAVTSAAAGEDWYADDDVAEGPLQRSVNALGRALLQYHFPLDGCVEEEDLPLVELAGVSIIRPEAMPMGMTGTYEQACARLGVEARPEGWSLWNTWGEGNLRVTMVVSAVDTTEGLLMNWAKGRKLLPVMPLPSQIAQVHEGWSGSPTFSPHGKKKLGLDGHAL
ncbi:hypothetical protein [Actinocorallia populi]|uniref:hypothetical protein n=1 Tax=Actinocorallia populi TaxID=2079200 RepID=UPI000D0886F2|nr:hypothetical protein [Actinocorallia populi]